MKVFIKAVDAYTVSLNGRDLGLFTEAGHLDGITKLVRMGDGKSVLIDMPTGLSAGLAKAMGVEQEALVMKISPSLLEPRDLEQKGPS